MRHTRLAGRLELIRSDENVVGDLQIGGVSLPAIWPATDWDTEVSLTCRCVATNGVIKASGKPGIVARRGDSLGDDGDGGSIGSHEWAVIEIDEYDIVPQFVLLEGKAVVLTLDYLLDGPYVYPPKEDYEEAASHVNQWAACRYTGWAKGGPGYIVTDQVESLRPTGFFRWVKANARPGYEDPWCEQFSEVRWADSEADANHLREAWITELVAQGRKAQAEYDAIIASHRSVVFTDRGGSPYIGSIISGVYPHKGITVKWHWHWTPVGVLDNPVTDPPGLALLCNEPTETQLTELGKLAQAASQKTLAATTEAAKANKYQHPGAWPFWTHAHVSEALSTVGIGMVELPKCWGTKREDYEEAR